MCPLNRPDLGKSEEKLQKIRSQCIWYLSENNGALKNALPWASYKKWFEVQGQANGTKGKVLQSLWWACLKKTFSIVGKYLLCNKMSNKGKSDVKQQRDRVKENVVQLLQENNGKLGMGEFWQMYNKRFKTPVSKKDLGFLTITAVSVWYIFVFTADKVWMTLFCAILLLSVLLFSCSFTFDLHLLYNDFSLILSTDSQYWFSGQLSFFPHRVLRLWITTQLTFMKKWPCTIVKTKFKYILI